MQIEEANFWQNKNNAQIIIKKKKLFEDLINSLNNSEQKLRDLNDLIALALEEENLIVQKEILQNIKDEIEKINQKIQEYL